MTSSITGLGSGLDTNAIIEQLVALERTSQDLIRNRGLTAEVKLATYKLIRPVF